jgi:putative membrane protein
MLAWIRTATGLITFGFSIYKFFQLQHEAAGTSPHPRLIGAREFAIGAIGLGLTALCLATLEHRANIRALPLKEGAMRLSLSGVFAALLFLFGLLGMVAAIFRQ